MLILHLRGTDPSRRPGEDRVPWKVHAMQQVMTDTQSAEVPLFPGTAPSNASIDPPAGRGPFLLTALLKIWDNSNFVE